MAILYHVVSVWYDRIVLNTSYCVPYHVYHSVDSMMIIFSKKTEWAQSSSFQSSVILNYNNKINKYIFNTFRQNGSEGTEEGEGERVSFILFVIGSAV